jgi:DNA-directed RNA polymerase subunit RPC12/RpoP
MQPEARVKICQNCGETVDADDVFCIYCGTRLASAIVNSAASEQTGPVPAVGAFSVPGETEVKASDYIPAWNTEQEAPVEDAVPAWNAAVEAPAEDTAPAWNTEQEAAAENFAPAWNTEQEAPVQEAASTWGAENEEKTAEAEAQSLSAAWSTPDDSSMQNLDLLMEEDATVRLDNTKNTLEGFDESSTMVNEPGGSYAAEMSSAPYAGGTGEGAYTSEEPAAPYTAEMPAEQYEAGIPAASYAAEMPAEQYSPEPVPGEAADENAESVEEAPSEKIEEIICPHCGAKVPSVYSFCIFCGSQLAGAVSDHSEEDDDRTAGSHVGRESMEASNYDAGEPEEDQLKEDMRDNGMENYKDAGSGFFFGGSL